MKAKLAENLLLDSNGGSQRPAMRWTWIFFANVFFGCVAFSIVMPNLWLYLESLGATEAFYAIVVATFSCGEAVGAIAMIILPPDVLALG